MIFTNKSDSEIFVNGKNTRPITYFVVHNEKGGHMTVLATDEGDAIEKYYQAIESCIGHTLKICGCFGPKQPLNRSKVTRLVKVIPMGEDIKEFYNKELPNDYKRQQR